jgi:hypothetical protein
MVHITVKQRHYYNNTTTTSLGISHGKAISRAMYEARAAFYVRDEEVFHDIIERQP